MFLINKIRYRLKFKQTMLLYALICIIGIDIFYFNKTNSLCWNMALCSYRTRFKNLRWLIPFSSAQCIVTYYMITKRSLFTFSWLLPWYLADISAIIMIYATLFVFKIALESLGILKSNIFPSISINTVKNTIIN